MKTHEFSDNPEFQRRMAAFREKFEKQMAVAKKSSFDKLLPFLVSLGTEGERSAVVLGAERANVAVEALLKAFLLPPPNKTDRLFSSDGALGTFSKKVELAYRLGLIDLPFKQALDIVRSLRNEFAHATTVETLKEQSHADKVKALAKLISNGSQRMLADMEDVFRTAGGSGEQAATYLGCIMVLLLKLELVQHFIERPDIKLSAKLNYNEQESE